MANIITNYFLYKRYSDDIICISFIRGSTAIFEGECILYSHDSMPDYITEQYELIYPPINPRNWK